MTPPMKSRRPVEPSPAVRPAERLTAPGPASPLPRWRTPRGKLVLLGGLVGLWGVIGMSRWLPQNPTAPAPVVAAPAPGTQALAARTTPLPRLKRDLVALAQAPYPEEFHNIFSTPPPPPPPPPDPFYEGAKQLRYVAFLQAGEAKTAMLTQGTEMHTLTVGDTVDGRYRVLQVQDDAVVLASPEGDKQVRLALQGGATAASPGSGR